MMRASAIYDARFAKALPWRVGWASWLIVCGIGCSGCYQSAVVPPTASITPPVRPAPVITQPIEPIEPISPPSNQPIDPVTVNNPWKPDVDLREWNYIVLHHTASESGNVDSIHQEHLTRKDKNGNSWLGIGYHFVIGNGNGMNDGEIEPTFRWRQQLQGAHAGVANYNQHGIGVVLIGHFENSAPTDAQTASVKNLVGVLKREYSISRDKVIGHGDVKATECPGKLFPMSLVRDSVAMRNEQAAIDFRSFPTGTDSGQPDNRRDNVSNEDIRKVSRFTHRIRRATDNTVQMTNLREDSQK